MAVATAFVVVLRSPSALGLASMLAFPRSEAWLAPLLATASVDEITILGDGRPLAADLYQPSRSHTALLLVHGLSRAGRRHPELVRVARLLARQGTLVLVPHFEGLAAFRLSGQEVADIRAALAALAARHPRPGIVGFSFGAGPALIAAADRPELSLVGSFGGYADLRAVVRFLTTGLHEHRGATYRQPPEEYNRWKLLALLAGVVRDAADRDVLGTIAERKLADPGADTKALETRAGPEARAVLALVTNRRAEAVEALVAALPDAARAAIDALSPLGAIPRLRGRLLIAHGGGDASIPFTESLRLADASAGRARVFILETFDHTHPLPLWRSLMAQTRDAMRLVQLAGELLAADR